MDTDNTRVSQEAGTKPQGIGYKLLRIVTVIHPGEALTAFLLTLYSFLLFLAYYIIKPVRDALMMDSWPAETKSYLSAAIAVSVA